MCQALWLHARTNTKNNYTLSPSSGAQGLGSHIEKDQMLPKLRDYYTAVASTVFTRAHEGTIPLLL